MELRNLRAFVAVAEELHFGRAAVRLHIAQPALSRQIRRLEDELEVTLLERTRHRVRVTEVGRRFLDATRRVLGAVDDAVRIAQRAQRGEVGRLAIGFVGASVLLPDVLRDFRARHPDVDLAMQQMTSGRQIEALLNRQLDVGLLRPPVGVPGLTVEVVVSEPLVVALFQGHPLASRARVPLKALASSPFVLFPRDQGQGLYDVVVDVCQTAGFVPRIVQHAIEMQTIVSLVSGGLGVSLLPQSAQMYHVPGVVFRPLVTPSPEVTMALAWRSDDPSPLVAAFLRVVQEARKGREASPGGSRSRVPKSRCGEGA